MIDTDNKALSFFVGEIMAKEFAKAFYKSKAWQSCRKAYISQRIGTDGGMCERCKARTGYILHHKTALTPQNITDTDVTLNRCNLEYVCKACHDEIHYSLEHKIKPCAVFDDNGQVIPDPERDK